MYSIIVRTTFALRGPPRADGRPEMTMQPHVVDISPDAAEQLHENYLSGINPIGLVPALANDVLFSKPMVESTNISWYIADWYPRLLPAEHEAEIRELVGELHQINAGLLTMGVNGKVIGLLLAKTRELLGQEGISEEYRELLRKKEEQLETRVGRMTAEYLDEAIELTKKFLHKVQSLLEKNGISSNDGYLYGPHATVLDGHVLVFLCRLCDIRRSELIPPVLLEWAQHFRNSALWKEVVPSGRTIPSYM
ncbi:unnamed protein product [Discula destructiva]